MTLTFMSKASIVSILPVKSLPKLSKYFTHSKAWILPITPGKGPKTPISLLEGKLSLVGIFSKIQR